MTVLKQLKFQIAKYGNTEHVIEHSSTFIGIEMWLWPQHKIKLQWDNGIPIFQNKLGYILKMFLIPLDLPFSLHL